MDYIGSKEKLNDWIFNIISKYVAREDWKNITFLDGCCGSGSVSKHAIKNDFNVISNDILTFPSHILSGYTSIKEEETGIIREYIDEANSISSIEGFFYSNYSEDAGRMYFTNENAKKIDAIREYINSIECTRIKNYLLYVSLEGMTRVLNTTGVQAAYLKEFKDRAKDIFKLRTEDFYFSEKIKVYNENILDLINKNICDENILYLDPPYNERQYAPNYHLYETFVRNDNPEISGITGIRKWQENKSEFCSKKTCLNFLDEIVKKTKARWIFISYSSDGLLSIDDIHNLVFSKYSKESAVFFKKQRRYKADNNRDNDDSLLNEYLFVLEKDEVFFLV